MDKLNLFGVTIVDTTLDDAKARMESLLGSKSTGSHAVFFVNTSTMNLAVEDGAYRDVLNRADYVFGDGTGVRWAIRALENRKLKDNVNGTDLVPKLLRETKGIRYFLLGGEPAAIESAAASVSALFPDCELVGYHHGFWTKDENAEVVARINASNADLLLVGMGNPIQEKWIVENLDALRVPLVVAVGGLFAYWAGDLDRAPAWVRRIGMEWIHILLRQPHKWQRYLIGNTKFLARIATRFVRDRA